MNASGKAGPDVSRTLNSPESIASYFMEDMRHLSHEELMLVMFTTKNRLLHSLTVTVGTHNASLASPRDIFLIALQNRAASLVVLHNHPSGDPTLSREDISLNARLFDAGKLLQVPLLDHIIIGDRRYISLRERGLMPE
ncbi:MAG: hypothetical protein ILP12_02625 [Lachnospiraceae bacterium]|nr:hypothetical protein [Lachnospiraceae bacterium]